MIADRDSRGNSRNIDSAPPVWNVRVEEIEAARSRFICCSCCDSDGESLGPSGAPANGELEVGDFSDEGLVTARLRPVGTASRPLSAGAVACRAELGLYLALGVDAVESDRLGKYSSEGSTILSGEPLNSSLAN